MEVSAEGKVVTMHSEGGDTFTMKTEGQDKTTEFSRGHPTNQPHPSPNIAINRTGPHIRHRKQGKRQEMIGCAQVVYPLRARLQEFKKANLHPGRQDDTLEDELTDLRNGKQGFMAVRPKLIRAGYTTLDSIPRF